MIAMEIPAAIVAELIRHAREEAPRECCGLLIGRGREIVRSARARNLDPSLSRYLIDPADHFEAIRTARASGMEVIGAYHSHPTGDPVPSASDVAEASGGAKFLYVILALESETFKAFYVRRGTVEFV